MRAAKLRLLSPRIHSSSDPRARHGPDGPRRSGRWPDEEMIGSSTPDVLRLDGNMTSGNGNPPFRHLPDHTRSDPRQGDSNDIGVKKTVPRPHPLPHPGRRIQCRGHRIPRLARPVAGHRFARPHGHAACLVRRAHRQTFQLPPQPAHHRPPHSARLDLTGGLVLSHCLPAAASADLEALTAARNR
jgi:hypothetical protein